MTLAPNIASLSIDPQPTFCEGGGLAVAGGNAIMEKINAIRAQTEKGYWTQDWHPPGHSSFASTHGRDPFTLVWLKEGQVVGDVVEGEDGPEGAAVQMLWTDHGIQGTEEAKLHPALHVPNGDLVLRKGDNPLIDSYSCVFENDKQTRPRFANGNSLPDQLRKDGIDTVVLSGLALDVCVRDGAADLKKEGFRVVVVVDATAAITPEGKEATLAKFVALGIETTSTEELGNFFKAAPAVKSTPPAPSPSF
jgi:nicotinamidase/pyrazinamidase